MFVTGTTPGGTKGRLSTTECTYLHSTYLPYLPTQHCGRHATDALGGSGTNTPATRHAYQGNSDVGLRPLPPA